MQTGELIKQARTNIGMTQAELAKRLGVTPQAISQYERGIKNPKNETLKKIATALNIPWYKLLSDNPSEQMQILAWEIADKAGTMIVDKNGNVLNHPDPAKIGHPELTKSELIELGFPLFKSDDDQIAYLYSLLNDSGKFEAARCFFRHLDKDSIPEVIDYLQQLANTPQYQKK